MWWIGMEEIDFQEAKHIHNASDKGLEGFSFLYSDGSSAIIPSDYEWEEIEALYKNGDTVGKEYYQGEWYL